MIYTARPINIKIYKRRTIVGGVAWSFYRVSVSGGGGGGGGVWKLDTGNLSRALSAGKGNVRNYIIWRTSVCVYIYNIILYDVCKEENGEKGLALTAAVGAFLMFSPWIMGPRARGGTVIVVRSAAAVFLYTHIKTDLRWPRER